MICDIQFNAFISGSIGKPAYDIFKNHPFNNPRMIKNYQIFKAALRRIPGTWFPEPGYGAILPYPINWYGRKILQSKARLEP